MIQGIALLLGFQLAGEVVKRLANIPIPGPIIGLLLLFALLRGRSFIDLKTPEAFETIAVAQVATPLLRHLAILFVPSGVGVLEYFELFTQHGPALLFVLVASTLVTMAATALAFAGSQALARWLRMKRLIYKAAPLGLRQSIVSPERRKGGNEQGC
jgi:holin-like protein